MLPTRAAETLQGVIAEIMAALDRDFLDRIGHIIDSDFEKPFGYLFRAERLAGGGVDLLGQRVKTPLSGRQIKRLIAVRAKDRREMIGRQLAQKDVAIGDRDRPTAAVRGGTGIGPGRLWSDLKPTITKGANRPTARRNRMNIHHRRAHSNACDFGLKGALIEPRVMGHIGGGATHVKADETIKPCRLAGAHHTNDPARRAGEDGIAALEKRRIGEAAVRLHEQQPFTGVAQRKRRCDLIDIAAQNG